MEKIISQFGFTIICCIVFCIWFYQARIKFKSYVDKNPFGDYEQPRTAATLGVLGTFIGITIGLIFFDPDELGQSVKDLLRGMSPAFFTSVLGMIFSLYLKNYQANAQKNFQDSDKSNIKEDANIADLIKYLQESDAKKFELLQIIKSDLREEFVNIENILESNNAQIMAEFKIFGETLAKNNSKIFVEALNNTLKDFNNKLTEQFGENFKQLNTAVGRLLIWQENYKIAVETVTKNLQTTFEGLETAKNAVIQIEKSAGSFKECSDKILKLLVTANLYEQKLAQVLKEIHMIGENAGVEFKNLSEQINNTTAGAEKLSQQITENGNNTLIKLIEITEANFDSMQKVLETSCDETKKLTQLATDSVNSHVNKVTNNLSEKFITTANHSKNIAEQIENTSNRALVQLGNFTKKATVSVNSHVSQVTNNLSEKLISTADYSKDMAEQIEKLSSQSAEKLDEITAETVQAMRVLSKNIAATSYKQREIMNTEVQTTLQTIQKAATAFDEDAHKITKNISDSMLKMMKDNNESLKKSSENLSRDLDEKIKNSLTTLGEAMLKISRQLSKDYQPLVSELRKIVELSKRIGGGS